MSFKEYLGDFDHDEEYSPKHPRKGKAGGARVPGSYAESGSGDWDGSGTYVDDWDEANEVSYSQRSGEDDFAVFDFDLENKKQKGAQNGSINSSGRERGASHASEYRRHTGTPPRKGASSQNTYRTNGTSASKAGTRDVTYEDIRKVAERYGGADQYEPHYVYGKGISRTASERRRHEQADSRTSSRPASAAREQSKRAVKGAVSSGSGRDDSVKDPVIREKKGKKGGIKRYVVITAAVLLCLLVIYYSAVGAILSDINNVDADISWKDSPSGEVQGISLFKKSYVTNILLLGIDDDGGKGSRSDTIMIASINTRDHTIRLCSILRDCYVYVDARGSYNKINSAYAYGGASAAMQSVQNNFRVKLEDYVSIDMESMASVVDAVGGVDIELTQAEANQVNKHSHCGLTTSSGMQHLNGKQAVTYAQIRKIDSDFGRTSRQRVLINAIITQCKSLGIMGMMDTAKAIAPCLTTNLSNVQIANLILKAAFCLGNDLEEMSVPVDGSYSFQNKNGSSIISLDLKSNAARIQEFLNGELSGKDKK